MVIFDGLGFGEVNNGPFCSPRSDSLFGMWAFPVDDFLNLVGGENPIPGVRVQYLLLDGFKPLQHLGVQRQSVYRVTVEITTESLRPPTFLFQVLREGVSFRLVVQVKSGELHVIGCQTFLVLEFVVTANQDTVQVEDIVDIPAFLYAHFIVDSRKHILILDGVSTLRFWRFQAPPVSAAD